MKRFIGRFMIFLSLVIILTLIAITKFKCSEPVSNECIHLEGVLICQ
jgi:hypothetical protein